MPAHPHVFERSRCEVFRDRAIEIVSRQLGVSREQLEESPLFVNDLGTDSLDTVDLVMELEEELELP